MLPYCSVMPGRLDEGPDAMTAADGKRIFTVLRFSGRGRRDLWDCRSETDCRRRTDC